MKVVASATLTRDPAKIERLALHQPRYLALTAADHRCVPLPVRWLNSGGSWIPGCLGLCLWRVPADFHIEISTLPGALLLDMLCY